MNPYSTLHSGIASGNVQIAKGPNMYMLITDKYDVYTSATLDGTWTKRNATNIVQLTSAKTYDAVSQRLIYNNGNFYALFDADNDAVKTKVAYSVNGDTWTFCQMNSAYNAVANVKYFSIHYHSVFSRYYVLGWSSVELVLNLYMLQSSDGLTFNPVNIYQYDQPSFYGTELATLVRAAFFIESGSRLIMGGYMGCFYTDEGYLTMTLSTTSGRNVCCGTLASSGVIVTMDIGNQVRQSLDNGETWSNIHLFNPSYFTVPFMARTNSKECIPIQTGMLSHHIHWSTK